MKIGMIVRGVYPQHLGGQEIQASMIINKLIQEKTYIYIITNSFKHKISSDNNYLHLYYSPIPKLPGLRFILKSFLNFLGLIRIHKKNRLNVVHGHGTIAEGLATILFSKLFKIKNIITIHGGGVINFGKKFPTIVKFILKNADTIITTNKFLKNEALKLEKKNIVIIPNSIYLNHFKPLNKRKLLESNLSNYKDKFILLTVSRLEKNKNIDSIIDLVKNLKNKIPNLQLLIIGEGKQKKSLIKKVKGLGLSSLINFLGKKSQNQLPYFYNIADLFITLSPMEGQGITILEAMSCECIVIANKVGGIIHTINHEKNGFLIEKNNKELLKSTILKIYKKEYNIDMIKKNSRKEILNNYDWNKNFKKLLNIYRNLL